MPSSSSKLLDHSGRILVFGRDGQVGRALQLSLKNLKAPIVFLGRSDCNLTSERCVAEVLNYYQPQVIINAAAYTAVDKAESEREIAFAINAKAPELMARYIVKVVNGILVHYSTDYVFADLKKDAYLESDSVGPIQQLNVYGQSKAAGELLIQNIFNISHGDNYASYTANFARYFILRASWIYGDGNNFISTILGLARESDQLKLVADQVGTPTSAQWLAEISMQIIYSELKSGTYHVVPDGETSWYELAMFVIETASNYGWVFKVKSENIFPILAADRPMPARRPYNSRLNNEKLKRALLQMMCIGQYPNWRKQVKEYVLACRSIN